MNIGPRGIALVKRFEGLRLEAYRDSKGVLTIGYGHTRGVMPDDTITEARAETLLVDDLRDAERAVKARVTVPLTQSMFDALVSWTFNLGGSNLYESTLRKQLNAGNYPACPAEMTRWYKTKGSEWGLATRRALEAALFVEDGRP